jgi:sugar phosphate isomerase/epimerase
MKIGVRNDCVAGNSLQEKMQILKELGYDFAELVLSAEAIDNLTSEDIKEYNRISNETGLPFLTTSIGHFPFFADKEPEERKIMVEQVKKVADLTAALGGDVILIATKESGDNIYSCLEIYKNEFRCAADHAWAKGVSIALEPVGGYKTSLLGKLVREIGHPGIGLYYDMGNCMYAGEDPVEQAWAQAPIIKAIHIKGMRETTLSQMPLNGVLKALTINGFEGPGCIEIASKDGTNAHLESAIKILRGIGY